VSIFKSLKNIAKLAAPILGAGIGSLIAPGSPFLASALGGGIGSLLTGAKPGEALATGLSAGVGGKFLGGKLGGVLGKAAVPIAAAASAAVPTISKLQMDEYMRKMKEMYPDESDARLQDLILKQLAKAPSNYEGFEDMQVESSLIPKVANGGVMDLRQSGGMSLGPGTEKSDDIPAMLSDGEFVMTARAVRGFGNGSRAAGAKKLYQMMDNAESNVPS
jgi:hypothetical protein